MSFFENNGALARFESEEMVAELFRSPVTPEWPDAVRLVWNDRMPNEWTEHWPDQPSAYDRLGELVAVHARPEDKGFDRSYTDTITGHLSWEAYARWEARDFIISLGKKGWPVRTYQAGGGIILHELWVEDWLIIVDDCTTGYAQIGLYPKAKFEDGEPSFTVVLGEGHLTIDEFTANKVLDLIHTLMAGTVHEHQFVKPADDGWPRPCRLCGIPESPF